jgi:hypothetical protein
MAKVACCQTGNEQLEFLFGENDSNQWRENYASSVTGSKVVKSTTSYYGDCSKKLGRFFQNLSLS